MQARGQLRLTWRLYAESPQSGEISRLHGQESIEEGDLSTQHIIGAIPICLPCRHAAPLEMTMLAGSIGHTFGVRVNGTSSRRFLRFLSLTALWAEGGGIALTGDEHKISVTGLVSMSYGMICILANQPANNGQRTAVTRQPMPVIPPRAHRKAYLYRMLMLP